MLSGYLGLFISAFLAATVLPLSSEAVLVSMHASGAFAPLPLLAAAATGNTLGAVVNWLLGRFLLHWRDRRWFPVSSSQLEKAGNIFNRYGWPCLLAAWLPFIGDALTVFAGVARTPFWLFLLLVGIGKTARYVLLLGLIDLV